jgi:hypothetical protein
MKLKRVEEILENFQSKRILVIGDLMLDEFVWGRVSRISPEAPVPVVDVIREVLLPWRRGQRGEECKGIFFFRSLNGPGRSGSAR